MIRAPMPGACGAQLDMTLVFLAFVLLVTETRLVQGVKVTEEREAIRMRRRFGANGLRQDHSAFS